MRPMAFEQLVDWILTEKKKYGTVFGERHPYYADAKYNRIIFGRNLETPIGPAAGPNTQLTQNIVAAYYTGSRFFELKTVQVMDGDELAACINRPCIKADDECYNCEWSTELFVPQAMEEYIKAWFLLKVLSLIHIYSWQRRQKAGYLAAADLHGSGRSWHCLPCQPEARFREQPRLRIPLESNLRWRVK